MKVLFTALLLITLVCGFAGEGSANLLGQLATSSMAVLPACPCTPGLTVRLSDHARTLWVSDGATWHPIEGDRVNVQWFGAKANDGLDDGAAIIKAAAAVQAAGKGELYFPNGQYDVYQSGTAYRTLASFNGLNNISLSSDRATLALDPTRKFSVSYGTMFEFIACSNIRIDGFDVKGPNLDISKAPVRGVEFVRFLQGCRDIDMPSNKVRGVIAGVIASKRLTEPDSFRTRKIHIGLLDVTDSFYGINCQFSGDDMVVDLLKTDTIHRSYFVYGVSNHKVTVRSKDPWSWDCLISTDQGVPTQNIDLTYTSGTETIRSSDGSNKIFLRFGDSTPGTLRNIRLNLNVKYAAAGQTGAAVLRIEKWQTQTPSVVYDSKDRGHVLDGLTITGYIEGKPHCTPASIINHSGLSTWGTGDTFRNVKLENLTINSTAYSQFHMRPFKNLTLENVRSSGNFILAEDNSPSTGTVEIINSDFPNLYNWIDFDNPSVLNVRTGGNTRVATAWSGRTINNGGQSTDANYSLPAATSGMEFTFVEIVNHRMILIPAAGDRIKGTTAINQSASTNSQGAMVHIKCVAAGTWEVTRSKGTITYD